MRFVLLSLVLVAGDGLSEAEFKRLHSDLLGKPEAWLGIPWETSLGEACRRAAREKKPLLLWSRMGNPLVCT